MSPLEFAAQVRLWTTELRRQNPAMQLAETLKWTVAATVVGYDGDAHRVIDHLSIDVKTRVRGDDIKVDVYSPDLAAAALKVKRPGR